MAIQEYVSGEELKKLIDDKLINANSVKQVIKKRGVFPVCSNNTTLSELIHTIFWGSGVMSELQSVMNFEQNNQKSTVVVIKPKNEKETEDFLTVLSDEFVGMQRIASSKYQLKNISKNDEELALQYCYDKPQKGRIKMAEVKEVSLDVKVTPLPDGQYKVNIRHEGMSESKKFVSLLEDMAQPISEAPIFGLRRITLNSLLKAHKIDFFDNLGAYQHRDWQLVDITNVTLNKNETVIDDEDVSAELGENEPTGRLSGISTAILTGGGLRNNDFVKECMEQNFVFSSMRYKVQHKSLPTTIEIDITFKQNDLKVNIIKSWKAEDDGKECVVPLTPQEQDEYIDYFQNVAYEVYSSLLEKQKAAVAEVKD